MAQLRASSEDNTETLLDFKIGPSEYYSKNGGEWVRADIVFVFGQHIPKIIFTSDGQEDNNIYYLVSEIRSLCSHKKESLSFEPLEPDYEIIINRHRKNDSSIEFTMFLDGAEVNGGGYNGAGPGIHFYTNAPELNTWADELEKETKLAVYKSNRLKK